MRKSLLKEFIIFLWGYSMERYRIIKVGRNNANSLSELSTFGDTQEFFEGYSINPPTVGERFVLREGKLGRVIIDTSPIVEIREKEILTTYSRYSIEEI